MNDLLIGVDIGTTNLKVGVFTVGGECRALAERPCPLDHRDGGRIEVDPEVWWKMFEEGLGECLVNVDPSEIRAIGVSSQAQTHVLLDADGNPLGPAISWLDATGDGEGFGREVGSGFYEHTGWPESGPMLAAGKFRQYSRNNPNAWDGVAHMVFADGYLIHRLTGRCAVSRNLAAMSGLYSLPGCDWWPSALKTAGIPRNVLPYLCETGESAGTLLPDVQVSLRLGPVPVVAGANDQTAAAIGAGICDPGQTVLNFGTAMVVYQVVRPGDSVPACLPLRGPYVGGRRYQLVLSIAPGGYIGRVRNLTGNRPWPEFYRRVLSVEPGAGGLRFVPEDTGRGGVEGTMAGIGLNHVPDQMARAVLEGAACAARARLDQLGAGETVRLTGGGSSNDAWVQTMADIIERRLERLDQPQTGLFGTALAAGQGAGIVPDLLAAARDAARGIRVFNPSGKHTAVYRRVYRDFQALYSRNHEQKREM